MKTLVKLLKLLAICGLILFAWGLIIAYPWLTIFGFGMFGVFGLLVNFINKYLIKPE